MQEKTYWPFKTLPEHEQSNQHQAEISFLKNAYEEGYRPYVFGNSNFGLSQGENHAEAIHRGRNRYWELIFPNSGSLHESFFVDGFRHVAEALLRWARGEDVNDIVSSLHQAVVPKPGFRGW